MIGFIVGAFVTWLVYSFSNNIYLSGFIGGLVWGVVSVYLKNEKEELKHDKELIDIAKEEEKKAFRKEYKKSLVGKKKKKKI